MGGSLYFYTMTTYMQKFLVNSVKIDPKSVSTIMTAALVAFMLLQPAFGALSDRIGRKNNMICFSGLADARCGADFVGALRRRLNASMAFVLIMAGPVIASFYTSISGVVKAELFPAEVRALGVGLPYAIANALFGGTAEYVALSLKSIGYESSFFYYVALMAGVTLAASFGCRIRGPTGTSTAQGKSSDKRRELASNLPDLGRVGAPRGLARRVFVKPEARSRTSLEARQDVNGEESYQCPKVLICSSRHWRGRGWTGSSGCRARRTSTWSSRSRTSSIELVLTRHEQAAAFMAATHGRLTGRPGVCIATLGPGALNFSTGAAYAHLGAMPMILITGQKAIMTARQARFQIVDVIASMKPLTKMTRQIVSAASIPAIVREAFRVAMEERPGPVHLELPEDVAGEEVEPVPLVPPHPVDIPVAHPAALDRAAEMILAAKNPLIMLGAAASRPRMTEELSAFVHRTGCRSSTRRWARARSRAGPTSTWARPRSPSATTCTGRSTGPT